MKLYNKKVKDYMTIQPFNVANGLSVGEATEITVITETGNVSANSLSATGTANLANVNATGNITSNSYFIGDGSLLTGIAPTVQVYEFANVISTGGYYEAEWLADYTPGTATTVGATVTTTPTLLASFVTQPGYPNINVIPTGAILVRIESIKSSGPQGYYVYAEIYKRDSGGTETLIATTDDSSVITQNAIVQQNLTAYISTPAALDTTDSIVVKVYAVMVSGSTTVSVTFDNNTGSGLQLPALPASISSFVPYTGAVANVDLGAQSLTTANLTVGGISNLGEAANVHITGGNVGDSLITDGIGNLSWAIPSQIASGTSNVWFDAVDGNLRASVGGTYSLKITPESVALGSAAGVILQGANTVAIGAGAGFRNQGDEAVAIGAGSANYFQSANAISIGGDDGGEAYQGDSAISIGYNAGMANQGANAIAIGRGAGSNNQPANSIIINATGANLDGSNQGFYVAPVRNDTGNTTNTLYYNTTTNELTYGPAGGGTPTEIANGTSNVSIPTANGSITGNVNGEQVLNITPVNIAIGTRAGADGQANTMSAIAIGIDAGSNNQQGTGIAIGAGAGQNTQGFGAVALGVQAGSNNQGQAGIAIGQSGVENQGNWAVAVGVHAGYTSQGANAIAIGAFAGYTNQPANSIIINASGANLDGTNEGFYVAPVRSDSGNTANAVYYNVSTNELTYGPSGGGNTSVFSNLTVTGTTTVIDSSTSPTTLTSDLPSNFAVDGFYPNVTAGSGSGNGSIYFPIYTSAYPSITVTPDDKLTASGDYTVEAWFRGTPTVTTVSPIYSTGGSGTYGYTFGIGTYDSESNFVGWCAEDINTGLSILVDDPIVNDGQWHHIALVVESGVATLYGDGAVVGTGTVTGATDFGTTSSLGAYIGRNPSSSDTYAPLEFIYDIRISNVAIYTAPFTPGGYSPTTSTLFFSGVQTQGLQANSIITSSLATTGITNLGDVGNIVIGGGTSNYVLTSDGAGGTYWSNPVPLSIGTAFGSNINVASYIDFQVSGTAAGRMDYSSVALGVNSNPGLGNDVAIGAGAGNSSTGSYAVAIGAGAGNGQQLTYAVAVGYNAGAGGNQGQATVAVGPFAGQISQGNTAVAIGSDAGSNNQGAGSVAVGYQAGGNTQGIYAVAIGSSAGGAVSVYPQGAYAVAIGADAGYSAQGERSVAIGLSAGQYNLANAAIVIGQSTNANTPNAIAIGSGAAAQNTAIVLSATGALSGDNAGFYVSPVRNDTSNVTNAVYFNTTSKEVTYGPIAIPTSIANGTSNVRVPLSGGNVLISVGGTANVMTLTSTGVNVPGTFTANGNITGGNISTAGVINVTGNITGGNLSTAGTLKLGANITAAQSGTKLYFYYDGVATASIDSNGNLICAGNVTAFGTP